MTLRLIPLLALALLTLSPAWADEHPPADATPAAEAPAAPAPAPHIACDAPNFNFGSADASQSVEHEYVLRNTGNLTLEISQVRPSCGCTVANISEKSVPPGAESRVTARLSLQGRTGHQHKTIVVESNDPQQPQLMLTMEGDVATPVAVQPERVIFGQIGPDANTTSVVMVTSSADAFHINSVESGSTTFKATSETVEEGKQYRILVSTQPPLPPGGISGSIRVSTDHPGRPFFEIPVAAAVLSEIMVAPQELIINAPAGQTVSQFVVVRPGSGHPFSVSEVFPPDPSIQVDIQPFGADGYRISLQNITVSPELNGKVVRITTSSESMHEILVPFRVNVPQA
jgi:hypothetical protein